MGITVSLEDTIRKEVKDHKNAHLVLVEGMSKLMTGKVDRCVSSDFHVGGLKWNIEIIPEGDALTYGLRISDSKCIGSKWRVNCSVKLTLYSDTSSLLHRETTFCSACFGEIECLKVLTRVSFKELKEDFIVNDKSAFAAEITEVKPKFLDVTRIPRTMGTAERIKLMELQRDNSKFTWKINRFSSFIREHHSSFEFTFGPMKWYLQVYPKGDLEGKGNSLSLYLHASDNVTDDPDKKTLVVYNLRVLDQRKRNHHEIKCHGCFSPDSRSGIQKFLALEELYKASNGFLVNDEIYLGVEFLSVSTTENV